MSKKKTMKIMLAITMMCMLISCSEGSSDLQDPVFCTEELRPGLEITVKDIVTDSVITNGITVIAFNTDQREELKLVDNRHYEGAYEEEGSYLLEIKGEKYTSFSLETPIVVEADICHVITETREVFLTPSE